MTDPIVYDEVNGLVLGYDGTHEVTFGLISSPGLLGKSNDADNLNGGFSGSAFSPLWQATRTWTTQVEVSAADDATWRSRRNEFLAATSTTAELEYTVHDAGEVRTFFTRITDRQITRDEDGEVFHDAEGSITFASIDPVFYGPESVETATLENATWTVESDGWATSERWTWTVDGPCTNPMLATSLHAGGSVRYVGTIGSGRSLVVELLPRGSSPGYYAKVVDTVDIEDYRTPGVGTNAYPKLDGGPTRSGLPTAWFGIEPGEQVITFTTSGDNASSTFTWRPGFT